MCVSVRELHKQLFACCGNRCGVHQVLKVEEGLEEVEEGEEGEEADAEDGTKTRRADAVDTQGGEADAAGMLLLLACFLCMIKKCFAGCLKCSSIG